MIKDHSDCLHDVVTATEYCADCHAVFSPEAGWFHPRRADRPEARVAEGLTVEALAAALRDARKRSGMTLRDASRFVEVHFSYLSKVENGHERPGDYLVMRLCNLYGTDPEPLLLARAVADVPEPVRAAILANLPAPRVAEPSEAERLRDALVAEWDSHDEAGLIDDLDAIIEAARAPRPPEPDRMTLERAIALCYCNDDTPGPAPGRTSATPTSPGCSMTSTPRSAGMTAGSASATWTPSASTPSPSPSSSAGSPWRSTEETPDEAVG